MTDAQTELRGNFDGVGPDGTVSGWCWSPDEPTTRRRICVELDGTEIVTIIADKVRQDLLEAGVGDGAHAFWGLIPREAVQPGGVSVVALRDAATGLRIGQDVSISWPQRDAADAYVPNAGPFDGALDRVTRDGWVSGWCWYPDEPARRVELAVLVDGEIVGTTRAASYRPDLEQAGIGDGAHAFSYALPWSVMGAKGLMTITVRDGATARPLGDPITLRLGKMAATEERIEDLERQVRLLRGHLEEMTERARRPGEDATRALFQTVGAFFQGLAEDVDAGRALGPATGLRGVIADVTERYAPLTLAVPVAPSVTICIDATASFDRLYRCLASLHATGIDADAEIVVIDDGGQSGEAALLPLVVRNVSLRHARAGTSILALRNEAARAARGAIVVFLAAEIDLPSGWLAEMLATFAAAPEAAAIGSRVVRADGTLLHAGLLADETGLLRAAGAGEDAAHPAFAYLRPVHALPDLALVVRADALAECGGLAVEYGNPAHAAIELCLRLRERGRAVLCQAASTVRWAGDGGPDAARILPDLTLADEDTRLLRHRVMRAGWHLENGGALRVTPLGRALVIDTEIPRPDRDAGSIATFEQMRLLSRLGYHVTFAAADGQAQDQADVHRLESNGIELVRLPGNASVTECLEERGAALDLVQVYRHVNANLFLDRIRILAPKARMIFSPADLHYLREEREAALAGRDADVETAATRATELRCVAAADLTILPSDFEVRVLSEHVAPEKLTLLRWIAPVEPSAVGFAKRHGACFVGNFNHGPNKDGVLWFVAEILPLVLESIPDFRFHLAGSSMGPDLHALASDSVVVHGWVPELAPFFAEMRASIAPLRYGAGFKGKIGTSLAHGLPAVSTPIGLEGTGLEAGEGVLLAADAADFAAELVRLHSDQQLWSDLSSEALERCAALYSPEAALEIYRDALEKLGLPIA